MAESGAPHPPAKTNGAATMTSDHPTSQTDASSPKKLRDMTPDERALAVRKALATLQTELETNAPALAEIIATETVHAEPYVMGATIRRTGGSDYGHVAAVCSPCEWQSPWYPRRTIEGGRLAERDRDEHNRTRHGAGRPTDG